MSVPPSNLHVDTLDPDSWSSDTPFVTNGKNPRQNSAKNLPAQAVTHGTGGMATHWTCAVPHFHKELERPFLPKGENGSDEWEGDNGLYKGAGELLYRSETEFDHVSIRHTLILNTLNDVEGTKPPPNPGHDKEGREFRPLPLAARRLKGGLPDSNYVYWMGSDAVFDELILQQHTTDEELNLIGIDPGSHRPKYQDRFRLLTNHRVTRYALKPKGDPVKSNGKISLKGEVDKVEVRDLLAKRSGRGQQQDTYIKAKIYVTAAGAVANPQILFNSGFNNFTGEPIKIGNEEILPLMPNLGRYITEQPMAFCQVVLRQELVESVKNNPYGLDWWKKAYERHQEEQAGNPNKDPLPFPTRDPEPQITSPVTDKYRWHTQIHRDAFSYGQVAATIDSRIVCDFRWFGMTEPEYSNRIKFEYDLVDAFGMPQPTFEYTPNQKSKELAHQMMTDMCKVAHKVGGFLPGSEPQFMAPGLALHLGGTTRINPSQDPNKTDDSCADYRGQVHDFDNLFVAGNGVIPTKFAANPTLTSMGLAIYSAEKIAEKLGKKGGFKRVVLRKDKPWGPNDILYG